MRQTRRTKLKGLHLQEQVSKDKNLNFLEKTCSSVLHLYSCRLAAHIVGAPGGIGIARQCAPRTKWSGQGVSARSPLAFPRWPCIVQLKSGWTVFVHMRSVSEDIYSIIVTKYHNISSNVIIGHDRSKLFIVYQIIS